jgi:hypothetical protein
MANVPKDIDIFDENDGAIRGDILHLIIEVIMYFQFSSPY